MSFTVERNVPIPPRRVRNDKGYTAAIRKLGAVGESVLLPGASYGGVYELVKRAGLKGKTTCRQVDGGVRVWRTKE